MDFIWLLDAGHGGYVNGKYDTCHEFDPINNKTWKKMYVHDGVPIFEGVINRQIIAKIKSIMEERNLFYLDIVDSEKDLSLSRRVNTINLISSEEKLRGNTCILFSQHSNAGGGKGIEIFTTPGVTGSDEVANVIGQSLKKEFPEFKFRSDMSDGDLDKESPFYVLRKTTCKAVLAEFLFFDNKDEAKALKDQDTQWRYADAVVNGMKHYQKLVKT